MNRRTLEPIRIRTMVRTSHVRSRGGTPLSRPGALTRVSCSWLAMSAHSGLRYTSTALPAALGSQSLLIDAGFGEIQ